MWGLNADDVELYRKNKNDLVGAVELFKIFVPQNHRGTQGIYNVASTQELEIEFGTSDVNTIIDKILREGIVHNIPST